MRRTGGVLSSVTLLSEASLIDAHKRRRAVFIVVACTLIGALAQVLIKLGAAHLEHTGLIATALGIFTIPTLFAGYCLYGVFTVLLVFALRDAELSILYPVIALSYVWVTLASVMVFHESMNLPKAIGLAIIVLGVAVLGRGGTR
jgi:drug/metabolite transporter (DMT)-like permease